MATLKPGESIAIEGTNRQRKYLARIVRNDSSADIEVTVSEESVPYGFDVVASIGDPPKPDPPPEG